MTVTAFRAQFIRQDYRIVKTTDAAAASLYGSYARKTNGPIPTSLEAKADAQAIVNARPAILNNGRNLGWTVRGEQTGLDINYVGTCPSAHVIDDARGISRTCRIDEIQIAFGSEQTILETWG